MSDRQGASRGPQEVAAELQRWGWGHHSLSIEEICAALLTTDAERESLRAEVRDYPAALTLALSREQALQAEVERLRRIERAARKVINDSYGGTAPDNEYHYGAPFFHELDACLQEGSS